MRLKFFHWKSLNSSFVHSFFGCPNFFESLEGSPQNFRHCETKTIDRIVLPYYPKAFRYKKISETQRYPYEVFRYCETKRIDRIVKPLLSETFWYQNIPETQTGWVRLRLFLAMWDKKNRQSCDTPIIEKLLIPEYFWKTEGFAHDVFRRFGTKKFRRKNVTLPCYPYFFLY